MAEAGAETTAAVKTFEWDGKTLAYVDEAYNHTRLNMRRVEIAVARWSMAETLRAKPQARVLEVGNVLGHYEERDWPVVDLRETGCINRDVMQWKPKRRFDLVVSISTVEHVQAQPSAVIDRLRSFLASDGKALVTVPTGYKPALDAELAAGTLGADRYWAMCIVPGTYEWRECTVAEALLQDPRACSGRWSGGLVILELAHG